jgi:hypothetical protein
MCLADVVRGVAAATVTAAVTPKKAESPTLLLSAGALVVAVVMSAIYVQ